ncbi:MAG: carbamoyltransferase HypF [Desulfovibrio desulfuricans]|nr:carbamoyltransferase HypF [Desulfovibrio desulfuricans]
MKTLRIEVRGIVQGVGFRPFVHRAADACGVRGSVANRGSYVEIFAQGTRDRVERLLGMLRNEPPERSLVMKISATETDIPEAREFAIVESAREEGDIFVSPDIATCPRCREELFNPGDRRYLHPFINCTACGPRLTILDSMPYDRERTSMGAFPMCRACAWEYTHAETRRYDAQPVCCNDCGPQVYMLDGGERGAAAITAARRRIMAGGIVAVKGIGGFHLCCDAGNAAAVARLRRLKRRPTKPFAVMLRDMAAVRRECAADTARETLLDSWQKPIVLLPRREGGRLCAGTAPDNPAVGVMLPYAPLQLLLFTYPDDVPMTDMLVMTSANASGAPICRTEEDARREISGFCDAILSHDRVIRLRADDSVMDIVDGQPSMIRRSRGYAPLPCILSGDWKGAVLGIGGELKNAFCLGRNELFYLSPHIGDLEDIRTVEALRASLTRMEGLLEIRPQLAACDLHPRYNSVAVAGDLGLPLLPVQHHYAHVAACMAENDRHEPVIGVAFDGTGYGSDGTIWGGELLVADYAGFRRAGHIRPFTLAGGDAAAREGWRVAAAMLQALRGGDAAEELRALGVCPPEEAAVVQAMTSKNINCVRSTSAGRLFDAVSALLGLRRASTFEGEASMALQFAAEAHWRTVGQEPGEATARMAARLHKDGRGPRLAEENGAPVLPTETLVEDLAAARLNGEPSGPLAARFHAGLAAMITACCERIREDTGLTTCALTGGVFQNRLLSSACARLLEQRGFLVLRHSLVPPNDGGLALGQAVIAAWRLRHGRL